MSHRATAIPPYVISYTPSVFTGSGNHTLSITIDNNASPTCLLDITSAFGTVVGAPVFTRTSSTQSTLVYTINVAPTGSNTNVYTLKLSHGGLDSAGTAISVTHGWDPSQLLVDDEDNWWSAASLTATHVDDQGVASWTSTSNVPLSLVQSSGADQMAYTGSGFNGQPSLYATGSSKSFSNITSGIASHGSAGEFTLAWVVGMDSPSVSTANTISIYMKDMGCCGFNMEWDRKYKWTRDAGWRADYGFDDTTGNKPRRMMFISDSTSTQTLYENGSLLKTVSDAASNSSSNFYFANVYNFSFFSFDVSEGS